MTAFILCIDDVDDYHYDICKKYFPKRYEKALKMYSKSDEKLSIASGYLIYRTLSCTENDIDYKISGKPYLKNNSVHFNISHSGKYVVIAVSTDEIGIDIEKASEKNLICSKRVFTSDEQEWVGEDTDRFSVLWTLKESVMKTLGEGLRLGAKDFDVMPFLHNESITVNGIKLYAQTAFYDSYALSLCSVYPFESIEIDRV